VILGLSCLVIGFVGGWFLRGDGGNAKVLPAASSNTATTTRPSATIVTASRPATPPRAVARGQVKLAVLNASSVTGLAGRTGDRAVRLGYVRANVVVGNAPPQTGESVAYYKAGSRARARQVARDLGLPRVAELPAGSSVTNLTPDAADSEVVVVLAG
jgi:hypothetical protein